jgi:hypothetical protein
LKLPYSTFNHGLQNIRAVKKQKNGRKTTKENSYCV